MAGCHRGPASNCTSFLATTFYAMGRKLNGTSLLDGPTSGLTAPGDGDGESAPSLPPGGDGVAASASGLQLEYVIIALVCGLEDALAAGVRVPMLRHMAPSQFWSQREKIFR